MKTPHLTTTAGLLFLVGIFLMIAGCKPDEVLHQDQNPVTGETKMTVFLINITDYPDERALL